MFRIILVLILLVPHFTYAADRFSAADKKAVEGIVHDYLIKNPQILIEMTTALRQQQADQMEANVIKQLPALASQLFFDKTDPMLGNPNGTITIVEFFDYQCPHCKPMGAILNNIVKNNANVRVIYKEFPIFGAPSQFATKAAFAAHMQGKYTQLHDILLNSQERFNDQMILGFAQKAGLDMAKLQTDMKSDELQKQIANTYQLAGKLGIDATPAFIIVKTPVNGRPVTQEELKASFIFGEASAAMLNKAIDKAK